MNPQHKIQLNNRCCFQMLQSLEFLLLLKLVEEEHLFSLNNYNVLMRNNQKRVLF